MIKKELEMASNIIKINDYSLYLETMVSLSKISNFAEFTVGPKGMSVYGKTGIARFEATTDAIISNTEFSFCIGNISDFLKILMMVNDYHSKDFSDLTFCYDSPFVKFNSKKVKVKFITQDRNTIKDWISNPMKVNAFKPVLGFTTSTQNIKIINNYTGILFTDKKEARLYLNSDSSMENNVLYAVIDNRTNNMNNSMTLKLGQINWGTLPEEVVFDTERLNLLNNVQSDEIKVEYIEQGHIVYKINRNGKNNTFSNILIVISHRKN